MAVSSEAYQHIQDLHQKERQRAERLQVLIAERDHDLGLLQIAYDQKTTLLESCEAALASRDEQDESLLRHWYCFSYCGKCGDSGRDMQACTYTGYKDKGVTLQHIQDNKIHAKLTSSAVLMSCSYLGEMTAEDFKDELPTP